jgi:hypothetical protein
MSLIQLLIGIIVVGFLLWVINTLIPMNSSIKKILNILVVILVVVYVLQFLGIFTFGPGFWVIR